VIRYALEIEYDGAGFVGWQFQTSGVSIQQVLEEAASRLGPAATQAAGRTDAGVHAEAQVVGLDLDRAIDPERLMAALNFHLRPNRVAVRRAAVAPAGWNARLSAIGREYRYLILNRRAPAALLAGRVWHVERRLDEAAMHRAAQALLGRHDFTSFRAAACQAKSPLRTLDRLDIRREGELIVIQTAARSFLHHQVRNMVGSLAQVGQGRWPESRISDILAARDRREAGPTAPPDGLTLVAVRYALDPFAPTGPACLTAR
jgi:tRNA pseudouridine38-40 synthase